MPRSRKKKPTELVSFTSRISKVNKEWIRKHAEMIELSQAAWFDGLLTSLRQAEESIDRQDGSLFDMYSQRIDAMVDQLANARPEKKK